jgi:hypothetical protein
MSTFIMATCALAAASTTAAAQATNFSDLSRITEGERVQIKVECAKLYPNWINYISYESCRRDRESRLIAQAKHPKDPAGKNGSRLN